MLLIVNLDIGKGPIGNTKIKKIARSIENANRKGDM